MTTEPVTAQVNGAEVPALLASGHGVAVVLTTRGRTNGEINELLREVAAAGQGGER